MSLRIIDSCINCDMCEPECPNSAISVGEFIYEIDPNLCTECQGYYDKPTCISVCPIDCIEIDPDNIETDEVLLAKFRGILEKT